MSHYNVNGAVAKTLIQHLIRWSAASGHYPEGASRVMRSILDQEISPELVPAGAGGAMPPDNGSLGPSFSEAGGFWRIVYTGDCPAPVSNWSTWTTSASTSSGEPTLI